MQFTYLLRFLFFGGLVWVVFFNISANPSVDAVAYAKGAVYGWGALQSHHVLHGFLGYWLWRPVLALLTGQPLPDSSTLHPDLNGYTWMAFSNGIAYLLLIFGLNRMLARRGQALHPAVLVAASAWGLLRFAVEYEAYLWPLVAVLAALYCLNRGRFLLAGGCFVLAILFHEISLLWLLAAIPVVWVRTGRKEAVRVAIWLVALPFLYLGIYIIGPNNMWNPIGIQDLVLGEFAAGGVKTSLGWIHLGLLPVSIMRTWVQAHGYQWTLLQHHQPYSLLLGTAGVLIASLVWVMGWVGSGYPIGRASVGTARLSVLVSRWALPWLLLAGLLSQGNAEFLAGLAPAVALGFAGWFDTHRKPAVAMAGLLFGVNVAFGLLPQTLLTLTPYRQEAEWFTRHKMKLATYHKLEVDTWLLGAYGPRPNWEDDNETGLTIPASFYPLVLHAQWLEGNMFSRGPYSNFLYKPFSKSENDYLRNYSESLIDTTIALEQMPAPALSRSSLLEKQGGLPPHTRSGKVLAVFDHIGGPTRLVELRLAR